MTDIKIEEALVRFEELSAPYIHGMYSYTSQKVFKDWLRTTLTSIYHAGKADKGEEVKRMVESLRTLRPTNSLMDVAMSMRRLESLSKEEVDHIKHCDNGLYIKMVDWASREETLDNVKEKI